MSLDGKCKECGKPILKEPRRHTFCSHKCAGRFYAKQKGFNIRERGKCRYCGKDLNRTDKVYCSANCQHRHYDKQRWDKIRVSGIVTGSMSTKKRFILNERGHKCEICGLTEWQNQPAPLVLDHINGDHSDDRIINLRLVCGNCDMQLPTYKSKNKGKPGKRGRAAKA